MEKTIFAADKVVSPSQINEKEVLKALFHSFLQYTFSYYPLALCKPETY